MDATRPLREVFEGLAGGAGEPAEALRANGHEDLPDGLVAQAVVNYADTAPIEVAEHLSPFVMAHSSVPITDGAAAEPPGWVDALSTAPADIDPGGSIDDVRLADSGDAGTDLPDAGHSWSPVHPDGAAPDTGYGHGDAGTPDSSGTAHAGLDWGTDSGPAQVGADLDGVDPLDVVDAGDDDGSPYHDPGPQHGLADDGDDGDPDELDGLDD